MIYVFLILMVICIGVLLFVVYKLKNKISVLEKEKDEALNANNGKTDFLTQVSHDIRTPLNAIVGFASSLEKAESIEVVKDQAKDIVSASNEILEIVNGILDISKLEEGMLFK